MDKKYLPSASLDVLKIRARILDKVRFFFKTRKVLEVETPIMSHATNPEPNVESMIVQDHKELYYLQTSPEFHMKRLLSAGIGPIYQFTKAFRKGEAGIKHNPEFTMLEWYQPNMYYLDFINYLNELLLLVLGNLKSEKITYRNLFLTYVNIDPFDVDFSICEKKGKELGMNVSFPLSIDAWLDLFLTHKIEPELKHKGIVYVYDFPVSQAALSRIKNSDPKVAERFEVYVKGVEIGNGFYELTDPKEQYERFMKQLIIREQNNKHIPKIDNLFIDALKHMPQSTGVALGFDRLLMVLLNKSSIQEVQAFPIDRA